jgi:hypothetical protein
MIFAIQERDKPLRDPFQKSVFDEVREKMEHEQVRKKANEMQLKNE